MLLRVTLISAIISCGGCVFLSLLHAGRSELLWLRDALYSNTALTFTTQLWLLVFMSTVNVSVMCVHNTSGIMLIECLIEKENLFCKRDEGWYENVDNRYTAKKMVTSLNMILFFI